MHKGTGAKKKKEKRRKKKKKEKKKKKKTERKIVAKIDRFSGREGGFRSLSRQNQERRARLVVLAAEVGGRWS